MYRTEEQSNADVKAAQLIVEKLNQMILNKFVVIKNVTNEVIKTTNEKVISNLLHADMYLYDIKLQTGFNH